MNEIITDDLIWHQKIRDEERKDNKCKCGRRIDEDETICLVCEDIENDVRLDRMNETKEEE